MSYHLGKKQARLELENARGRHLAVLEDVRRVCVVENASKDEFKYLMAVPIIYSAWEGTFRITCATCIKRKCMVGTKARNHNAEYTTLWLQREKFVETFLKNLLNAMNPGADVAKTILSCSEAFDQVFSLFLANFVQFARGIHLSTLVVGLRAYL